MLPLTQTSGTAAPPTPLGLPEEHSAPPAADAIVPAYPGAPELPVLSEVGSSASYTRLHGASLPAARVVTAASVQGIPATALAAYQRAEVVIDIADTSCHLPWQLLAAIGRVESDHGRYGGNELGADGISRPGIYGPQLNGVHGTARIRDTDAGLYDRDLVFDRAVGPMQFIPSTWTVVGVDADSDSRRDPQDIDDSALGAAVYLCSGSDDLSTESGRRSSIYRYNHSNEYVDLVLSIMDGYLEGDYTAGAVYPTSTTDDLADPPGPAVDLVAMADQPQHPDTNHEVPTDPEHEEEPPPPADDADSEPPAGPPGVPPETPPVDEEPPVDVDPADDQEPPSVGDLIDDVLSCIDLLPGLGVLAHSSVTSEYLFATLCGDRPAERRRTWE